MVDGNAVEKIILDSLHNLNAELSPDMKIKVGPHTALFGLNAEIDSLSLVSVIVDTETALKDEYGIDITLVDESAMARSDSPFADVQSLKNYILERTRDE